jgi:MtN3 and saliva related transmembrane protein
VHRAPVEASRRPSSCLRHRSPWRVACYGPIVLKAVDVIGWVSSITLLITLGQQVRKQWISRESAGVSTWLFVGQLMASVGFSIYSLLLSNWVFLTTNLLLVINALLGQWVTLRNRRGAGALPGV